MCQKTISGKPMGTGGDKTFQMQFLCEEIVCIFAFLHPFLKKLLAAAAKGDLRAIDLGQAFIIPYW